MKNLLNLKRPTSQAALALLIVFLIDLFTSLGISVGVLYVFCLFLVSRESKKTIIVFAIITLLLTTTKFIIFFSESTIYMALANRVITILVIIVIALFGLRHRKLADALKEERNIYIKELEEMLFMTSHRVRKPLTTCLGLMNLIETDTPMTTEEMKKVLNHLKESALELDSYTRELTTFIDDIKEKDKKTVHSSN